MKELSNGTLGLRFMQNAQRRQMLAQSTSANASIIELERKQVTDDGMWEVPQHQRGKKRKLDDVASDGNTGQVTYEASYLPFIFRAVDDHDVDNENAEVKEARLPPSAFNGRRSFLHGTQAPTHQSDPMDMADSTVNQDGQSQQAPSSSSSLSPLSSNKARQKKVKLKSVSASTSLAAKNPPTKLRSSRDGRQTSSDYHLSRPEPQPSATTSSTIPATASSAHHLNPQSTSASSPFLKPAGVDLVHVPANKPKSEVAKKRSSSKNKKQKSTKSNDPPPPLQPATEDDSARVTSKRRKKESDDNTL